MPQSKLFPKFLVFIYITPPPPQVNRDYSPPHRDHFFENLFPSRKWVECGGSRGGRWHASWALIQLAPSMNYLLTKQKSDQFKGYLHYKVISYQNWPSEEQLKNFFCFIEKLCFVLEKFKFLHFEPSYD